MEDCGDFGPNPDVEAVYIRVSHIYKLKRLCRTSLHSRFQFTQAKATIFQDNNFAKSASILRGSIVGA